MSRRARRRLCPALQSVFDALAANVNESCVVIIRPSGSKSRQWQIPLPAVDRALLCDALEAIDDEIEDGEPPDRSGETAGPWVTGEEDAEKESGPAGGGGAGEDVHGWEPQEEASEPTVGAEAGSEAAPSRRRDAQGCTPQMRAVLRVLREAGEPLTAKVIRTRLGAGAGSGGPRGALRQLAALGLAKRLRAGTWWLMEWGEPPEEVAED